MKFRKNVAAVIVNGDGFILTGKRTDVPDAWQLPQGGVDENETEEDAVLREIEEETGISGNFLEIISKTEIINYVFPPEIKKNMSFDGQEQIYFLLKISDSGWKLCSSNEFSEFMWLSRKEIIYRAVEFKKGSYIEAFRQLFGEKNGD